MFYRFDSSSFALCRNVLQIRVAWFCLLSKCSTDSSRSALPSFEMFYRSDCLDTYFFTPRQMFYRSERTQELGLREYVICETRLDRNMCIFHRLKAKSQPHWTLTTPLLHAKIMGKITIASNLTKSKVANWRIQLMRPRTRQLWCFWRSISMATRTQSQAV